MPCEGLCSSCPEPHCSEPRLTICSRTSACRRGPRGRTTSFATLIGDPAPSHVILVPWLVTGGSDRTAINYARVLHENRLAQRVVVIATEPAASPWARRLPAGVDFVELGRLTAPLGRRARRRLLTNLLLDLAPEVIHNINSGLGYDVFITHGETLKRTSRLYAHVFCGDLTPWGQVIGYSYWHLPKCFSVLTGVFGDNSTELGRLHARFGFDPSKLWTHYQPVEIAHVGHYVIETPWERRRNRSGIGSPPYQGGVGGGSSGVRRVRRNPPIPPW